MERSTNNTTDTELVVLATLGSIDAYDQLIQRYRSAVILVAEPIVGCRALAEDVAQEVFLKAFRALPQLSEPGRFSGWLRMIARNQARRTAEPRWKRPTEPLDALDQLVLRESTMLDPAMDLAARFEQEALFQALDKLPEDYREVLFLVAYEDWSIAQIAAFLSLNESTVRGRLFRARRALKGHFDND
jgi:RNA polymerase sigma-70 factor, ECF subfamily